jgi:hypothetical protein
MMRNNFVVARERLEVEAVDLTDLSSTPWRRIMLSARENIWCLVDAEDYGWLSEHIWNVSWGTACPWKNTPSVTRGRTGRRCGCIGRF